MLTLLLACPLIGIALILALPRSAAGTIRRVALVSCGFALLLGCRLLADFDPHAATMQFQELVPWIPQLNIFYHLGVDGLSLPMVFLTALI